MVLAFCYSLLDFASMLVPKAILGAVGAFWALVLEPFSTQLAPESIKHIGKTLVFAGCLI